MKPIMNSQELNEMFLQSKNECEKAIIKIDEIKKDIDSKIKIINYVNEYSNMKLDTVNTIHGNNKISFDNNVYGVYDQYGYVIHPRMKSCIDIFNLKLLSLNNTIGRTMFRKSVTCKVNDIENEEYINLLMEDTIPEKSIVFNELKENTIKIEYSLDTKQILGSPRFNTIEIDPYISGSINIVSIECYDLDTTGNLSTTPVKTISSINNIGKTRIILDEKIKFSRVVFTFKCNFKTSINGVDIYPFGIKHILFKEIDYLPESFAIIEISDNNFIDYIYNDIVLYTTLGKIETSIDMYNIEIYTDYNKILTGRVYASTNADINRIPKNTKYLYLKIPLVNNKLNEKEYLALTGIKLNYTSQEEIIL